MATEAQSNTATLELRMPDYNNVINLEKARQLREDQQIARQKEQEFHAFRETASMLGENLVIRNKAHAVEEGVRLGLSLRREIVEGRFDGGTFYAVLILSAIKDFVDLATLGLIGTLTNFIIAPALFIIFFMRGGLLKRMFIKRFIAPIIVKSIPFLSAFPIYTVRTIMLKRSMDKKNHALTEQVKIIDNHIEEIKMAA